MAAMNANAADGLLVAVASNFQAAAREIAVEFEQATGIPVRITSGSTGHLYAQIVNGAPYDVFLAADTERPRRLVADGLADSNGFEVYATGYLALWSNDPQFDRDNCFEDFVAGNYSRLAIANPETAPYGQAAKRVLQAAELWDDARNKLVFGENVNQAFQFVATRNASFGLVAASQVIAGKMEETSCFVVLSHDYVTNASVRQAGVVLKRSRQQAAATQFMQFIVSPSMHEFLWERGYGPPIVAFDGY